MKVIGVDIGGTKIAAGMVVNGVIKKLVSAKTKSQGSKEEVISQINSLIGSLIDQGVKSIGVGVPAIVEEGVVYETVNIPFWKKVPLKQILEDKYKVPVYINNDTNCLALGEFSFGIGKKYRNIAVITISTGFGAGLIINGELYNGNNCGAGEFGEMPFLDKKLEYYCSGQYFMREHKISGEELYKKAKQNNQKALGIFKQFGDNLGKALAMVVLAVDPELIIIGGSVSKAYKYFEKSMKISLRQSIYERTYSNLKIKVSRKKDLGIIGAAALCYTQP